MRVNRSVPPPTVVPVLVYPDVRAAVAFLSAAFGFAERTWIGESHRAQLAVGDTGAVIIADAGNDRHPPQPGGVTHVVRVRVTDVDAAFARATRCAPEALYGTVKMWGYLQRQGIEVAKCTVERLKRAHGWRGVTRARRPPRTTVADPAAQRAPDLVKRNFRASRPGELVVADFTYVPMGTGRFGYTAFVIDAFAGLIPGWECALSKETAFVEAAIRQAASCRARQGHPFTGKEIHHSDAGSQYTSVHFTETLMLAGLQPSIGTVGDAYDNALAETTIGLYKTECIREGSPFRAGPLMTLPDLEEITSTWVHWYNTSRLMHRLGLRPPAEAEAQYHQQHAEPHPGQAHK